MVGLHNNAFIYRCIMTKRHTYEAFCRAVAGIYDKHAKRGGNYYTCYVREAITYYMGKDEIERGVLMESAGRECLVGYKIAYSLLKAGWSEDTIIEYTDLQQSRVDGAEQLLSFDEAVNALYGHALLSTYAITMNYLRYLWLMDGAPDLEDVCQELLDADERLRMDEEPYDDE